MFAPYLGISLSGDRHPENRQSLSLTGPLCSAQRALFLCPERLHSARIPKQSLVRGGVTKVGGLALALRAPGHPILVRKEAHHGTSLVTEHPA
jgi:hypothetical protein